MWRRRPKPCWMRRFAGCECSSDQHRQFPLSTDMQLTVQQSSAIYFKRHKGSKRRAALFRQLRASSANQTRDVKQQTFGNAYIAQRLRSGQLWLRGFEFSMRAAMRHASAVRRTASQGVMSKRSASRSSDQEVMRHLSRSQIFKDYERAFSEAMGLPLNIRGHDSWSPAHHGKDGSRLIRLNSGSFQQGSRRLFKGPNRRISRTGLDNAHRYLVCGTLRKCSAGVCR